MNTFENKNKIKVIGVGGAGANIVSALHKAGFDGVDILLINTDLQDLENRPKEVKKLQIGPNVTQGHGAGSDPSKAQAAVEESYEAIKQQLQDCAIIFTVFGLGKGTGTGAGPEIAKMAKENGSLSIVLATLPAEHEGNKKQNLSIKTVEKIKSFCDSYTLYSNERLFAQSQGQTISQSYEHMDEQITNSIKTIVNITRYTGRINIDFADIKNVLTNAGQTIIATGSASGEEAAIDAVNNAVENPLFEGSVVGAKRIIVNILVSSNSPQSTMPDVINQIKTVSMQADIDVISGIQINDNLSDEIRISVIATSLNNLSSLEEPYQARKMAENLKDEVSKMHKPYQTSKDQEVEQTLNEISQELKTEDDVFWEEDDLAQDEKNQNNKDNNLKNKSKSEKELKLNETFGGSMYDDTEELDQSVDDLLEDEYFGFEDQGEEDV